MKKNKQTVKGLLPIVGMLIISLSLSGCKKTVEADVGAETTGITQAVGETTSLTNQEETKFVTEFEITDLTTEDLDIAITDNMDSIYPVASLPDGWTEERILNMISIDGYKISLPCSVNDIVSLSDDFEIENDIYSSTEKKTAYLFYKNEEIGTVSYYDNGVVYFILLYGNSNNKYICVEDVEIHDTEKIVQLLQILDCYHDNDDSITFRINLNNKKIGIYYHKDLCNVGIWLF